MAHEIANTNWPKIDGTKGSSEAEQSAVNAVARAACSQDWLAKNGTRICPLNPVHPAWCRKEAAHIELGHIDDIREYVEHRGIAETEAESVAYIVAGMVGFDTSAYSIGYIAGWADGDIELIKSTAARVLRATHTIAGILTPDETAGEA